MLPYEDRHTVPAAIIIAAGLAVGLAAGGWRGGGCGGADEPAGETACEEVRKIRWLAQVHSRIS